MLQSLETALEVKMRSGGEDIDGVLADLVAMSPLSLAIEKGASLEEVKVLLDANHEAASTADHVRCSAAARATCRSGAVRPPLSRHRLLPAPHRTECCRYTTLLRGARRWKWSRCCSMPTARPRRQRTMCAAELSPALHAAAASCAPSLPPAVG